MSEMMQFLGSLLGVSRAGDRRGTTSWWKLRYRGRGQKRSGVRRIKALRPWQAKQWFGPLMFDGKEVRPDSLETRQRKRQALRILCMKQITEKYGGEPRRFRRRIARRLTVKAFREMKEAA